MNVIDHLSRYGYLPIGQERAQESSEAESSRAALVRYQEFMSLPQTGEADPGTLAAMAAPRCGMPDHTARGARFGFLGGYASWDRTHLTWRMHGAPNEIGSTAFWSVKHAFDVWQNAFPVLQFRPANTGETADINVRFAVGAHCSADAFTTGVLAHMLPVPRGEIHVNDWYIWIPDSSSPDSPNEFDLMTTVVHEIGHVLGLDHSTNQKAVMFPTLPQQRKNLHQDDIDGVRSLYLRWGRFTEDMNASFGYSRPRSGSAPAVASWGPGRLDLFWRGDDDHLKHAWFPHNGGWSWEQDMTAQFGLTPMASNPTACSDGSGRLDVFWRSADGHIKHVWFPSLSGDWSGEQDMTTAFGYSTTNSAPAAASWGPGRFDLFWRSADNHIRHAWYPHNGDWSWEQDMTASYGLTPSVSAPATCSDAAGHLDLFWRASGGALKHSWFPSLSGDWSGEQDMTAAFGHGPASAAPAVASWQPGRFDLFWRGQDDAHLEHAWYPYFGDWSGTEDMTAAFGHPAPASAPAVASWGDERLDVFWVAFDGALKHAWFPS